MKIKKRGLFLVFGLLVIPPVFADTAQLVIAPSMDMAFKNDALSIRSGSTTTNLAKVDFKTLAPGIALGYGRWFGGITAEFTIDPGAFEQTKFTATGYEYRNSTFSRGETTFNVGYRIFEGKKSSANLYGGFHDSRSKILQSIYTYSSVGPTYTVKTERADFTETGPFVGANFTMPIGKQNNLTFSAAYALLDGKLDDLQTNGSSSTLDHNIYSANSNGLSLGLVWSGPLGKNSNYKIGYKFVDYNFDVTSTHNVITGITTANSPGALVISNQVSSLYFGATLYM